MTSGVDGEMQIPIKGASIRELKFYGREKKTLDFCLRTVVK